MRNKSSAKPLRERYYLSESGLLSLQNRLDEMRQKRIDNIERLKMLKEQQSDGVSLEDSSYIQALSTAQFLDTEIERIEYVLANVTVIQGQVGAVDQVCIGSCVRLEGEGQQFEYTIVNSIEADPSQGKISDESPLGRQLLGKKIKDIVTIGNSPKKKPLMLKLVNIS